MEIEYGTCIMITTKDAEKLLKRDQSTIQKDVKFAENAGIIIYTLGKGNQILFTEEQFVNLTVMVLATRYYNDRKRGFQEMVTYMNRKKLAQKAPEFGLSKLIEDIDKIIKK